MIGTSACDCAEVFAAIPAPCAVMDLDGVIVEVNRLYLEVTGRIREELVGRRVLDAFPEHPGDPATDGTPSLAASLERVIRTGAPDTVALRRPGQRRPDGSRTREERWWTVMHSPVLSPGRGVRLVIQRIEDVTEYVQRHGIGVLRRSPDPERAAEAELYLRAQQLQHANEALRKANAEERRVALALQRAMLYAPDVEGNKCLTVRYLPATDSLNVCGDWYDVADLSEEHLGAAVGDVVGHGLEAAVIMGMLRSALSAAIRASEGPARALEALDRYAESVEGALGTTAVKVLVNKRARMIIYSSAGHPPPILLHGDGSFDLLDKATDPPLGTWSEQVPRSQASLPYTPGDSLVLYTDGLIERPGECIDTGLARLTTALSRYAGVGADPMADALLHDLVPAGGARDDIALLIICP